MDEQTKTLYVRDVPVLLMNKAKAAAATEGLSFPKWIIKLIEKTVGIKK
jgi:predicted HicB family RNase H-like nuclease